MAFVGERKRLEGDITGNKHFVFIFKFGFEEEEEDEKT